VFPTFREEGASRAFAASAVCPKAPIVPAPRPASRGDVMGKKKVDKMTKALVEIPVVAEQPGDVGTRDTNGRVSSQVDRVRHDLEMLTEQRAFFLSRCGDMGKVLIIGDLHPISFNSRNSYLEAGDQGAVIGTDTDDRATVKIFLGGQYKDGANPRKGDAQYRVQFSTHVDMYHYNQTGKRRSLVEYVYVDDASTYTVNGSQQATPFDDDITDLEATLYAFEMRDS